MTSDLLPPFGEPEGPELGFEELIDAFLVGARSGYSETLHVEDDMLLADRMVPFCVRLGDRALLLRQDIPPGVAATRGRVERVIARRGLSCLEADARLGDIAAIQITGIRGAVWDLWGNDPERSVSDLRRAALGDDPMSLEMEPAADWGVGMTLDDLLDDLREDPGT